MLGRALGRRLSTSVSLDSRVVESDLCLLLVICLQDPYANGYEPEWIAPGERPWLVQGQVIGSQLRPVV